MKQRKPSIFHLKYSAVQLILFTYKLHYVRYFSEECGVWNRIVVLLPKMSKNSSTILLRGTFQLLYFLQPKIYYS